MKIPFRNLYRSKRKIVTPAKAGVQNMAKFRYGGTGLQLTEIRFSPATLCRSPDVCPFLWI
jgi:hypothetical protein